MFFNRTVLYIYICYNNTVYIHIYIHIHIYIYMHIIYIYVFCVLFVFVGVSSFLSERNRSRIPRGRVRAIKGHHFIHGFIWWQEQKFLDFMVAVVAVRVFFDSTLRCHRVIGFSVSPKFWDDPSMTLAKGHGFDATVRTLRRKVRFCASFPNVGQVRVLEIRRCPGFC